MFRKLLLWFFANALLPILVPLFYLVLREWITNGSFPLIRMFQELTINGFYVFSALALYFSLFEDYDIYAKCTKPFMIIWQCLLMIATLAMFYKMYNEDVRYFINNSPQFLTVWFLTAIFSIIKKVDIIKYKLNLRML